MKKHCLSVLVLILGACTPSSTLSTSPLVKSSSEENYLVTKQTYYFPGSAFIEFNDSTKADTSRLAWYSGMLRALKEPVLYTRGKGEEVYRFTCLRTFHPPFSIRAGKLENGQPKLVLKISDGAGGYTSQNLVTSSTKPLTADEWNQLKTTLQKGDFWQLPTQKPDFGCDGSEWILEGLKDGKYHVVDRWSPKEGSAYQAMCNKLLKLSGATIKHIY